ncbi:glycosyl transferase family 1 [Mycobacterium mantenii]|uniref:Glycosyl transferase family 1 n=2 Tax=Mycobacterium mantenii TaxID=560555 RepID=A0A1X0FXS9_MYCNT|nr:glycosyl transferase family 1 [Mycobacterium mantenii]
MSALVEFPCSTDSPGRQGLSDAMSFGILGTYPPTPSGLASFSAALADGLSTNGAEVSVVRVSDGPPSASTRVVGELVNGSAASVAACAELLNQSDVAVIQHEYGIYGGVDGAEVMGIVDRLRVPSILVAHTIPKDPTPQQHSLLEVLADRADQVVVMSEAASLRLRRGFDIARHKVATIPHGATVPTKAPCMRSGRPIVLTRGLLGPGKGIERVIEVMGSLNDLPGRPRYLVAGRTHPTVLAADGEAYRNARIDQALRSGVADSVCFDTDHRSVPMLTALLQSAAVVVLPYDSTDQVTSSALVDAIASGRPVVATAFPHAVELLASGAGIVVAHDDPDALACALRRVLTEPRLAGAMAAEARRLAPEVAWPTVARAYQRLAQRVLAQRRAGA